VAVQAEALGQEYVSVSFRGHDWRLPLDVDTWPLTPVQCSVGSRNGEPVVNHAAVAEALEGILGDQWDHFVTVAKRRGDLTPASDAFAAAVGIGKTQERAPDGRLFDRAFGAIPRLLAVLEAWPTAVESDLDRFWGIDYRDRWRFDGDRRRLTLRQIFARISHLPSDSALAIAMGRRSPVELLLMDVYEPLAGRVHPARPLTPEQAAERRRAAEAKAKALAGYEQRRQAREAREVPAVLAAARENARRGEPSGEEG
jgi:hypothetical protein